MALDDAEASPGPEHVQREASDDARGWLEARDKACRYHSALRAPKRGQDARGRVVPLFSRCLQPSRKPARAYKSLLRESASVASARWTDEPWKCLYNHRRVLCQLRLSGGGGIMAMLHELGLIEQAVEDFT
jgi:hypothetical protein